MAPTWSRGKRHCATAGQALVGGGWNVGPTIIAAAAWRHLRMRTASGEGRVFEQARAMSKLDYFVLGGPPATLIKDVCRRPNFSPTGQRPIALHWDLR